MANEMANPLLGIPIEVNPYLPKTIRDRHGDEYELLGIMAGAGGQATVMLGALVRRATPEEREALAKRRAGLANGGVT